MNPIAWQAAIRDENVANGALKPVVRAALLSFGIRNAAIVLSSK
jgi:hypothetical protein